MKQFIHCLFIYDWLKVTDRNRPMTSDKFYTDLSANTIMAKPTNHFQQTELTTSSTDKYYSVDSEDDFRTGCRNISHLTQFFSELHSDDHTIRTNELFLYPYFVHIWTETIFSDNLRTNLEQLVRLKVLQNLWKFGTFEIIPKAQQSLCGMTPQTIGPVSLKVR